MSSPSTRFRSNLSTGLAVLVGVWLASLTWSSTVDDAWISARYGASWAEGYGWRFSPGAPPVEGFSNPLWTAMLGVTHWLDVDPHLAMCGLGLAAHTATIALSATLARRLAPGASPRAIALAPWALALSPHLAVVSTNGLETSAFLLVVCLAWLGALSGWGSGLVAACVLAVVAMRPEGLLVAWPLWWATRDRGHRWQAQGAAWLALGLGVLTAWRLATFGQWLPNTVMAKGGVPLSLVASGNLRYLTMDGPLWFVAWLLLAASIVSRASQPGRQGVAVTGLLLAGVALRVELWMPGARLMCISWLCTALLLPGWVHLAGRRARALEVALAALLVAITVSLGPSTRAYDHRHSVQPGNGASQAGAWLADHLPSGATLAVRDAGVLAYWAGPAMQVAELHPRALTQPHPNRGPAVLERYVPANPEAVALTQAREQATDVRYRNDRTVFEGLTMPYRYVGRVYQHTHRYYDVYVRGDIALPEAPPSWVVNQRGPAPPDGRVR